MILKGNIISLVHCKVKKKIKTSTVWDENVNHVYSKLFDNSSRRVNSES